MKNNIHVVSLVLLVVFCTTCGSTSIRDREKQDKARETEILKQYTDEVRDVYGEYLVDIKKYTTRGSHFQEKYSRFLIAIVRDVVENKKLTVKKGTVGFYYDKKSRKRKLLYFGFDIYMGDINNTRYSDVALELIKNNLKDIMATINSARSMFSEAEVVGMVIGFSWNSPSVTEQVNLWVSKNDVISFEDSRLTLDEVIQRSTVTNTAGKIFRFR